MSSSAPFSLGRAPSRRGLARHRARERIEHMIVSGRFAPGEKIVQDDLAKRLGVARTVVREALFELQGLGLVQAVDRRGVVARLDTQRLLETFDLREAVEGMVARLCCDRVSRADLRDLREIAFRCDELSKRGDFDEAASTDLAFHLRLLELAGNQLLRDTVERSIIFRKFVSISVYSPITLQSHLTICDAIQSGDPNCAERAARSHVCHGRETFRKQIEDGTFQPRWLEPTRRASSDSRRDNRVSSS
jgi:DNA-binding GntR family transcriptional regulator